MSGSPDTSPVRAGDELLDGYHTTRHPVGARTLTNIQAQSFLLLGGHEVDALRETFAELMEFDGVRTRLARVISGLGTARAQAAPQPATASASTTTPRDRSARMDRLAEKTALVTGSSRGIGRATALRMAGEGALVAVHYASDENAARETVRLIEQDGGRAFTVQARLGVPGDVHELFLGLERGLKERTGGTTLDIVVNNAGEQTAAGVAPEDITPEHFDRLFAVNAKAPFFIVQRALALLPDGGRIINISSGLTRVANPEQTAYAMTKGAIEQISALRAPPRPAPDHCQQRGARHHRQRQPGLRHPRGRGADGTALGVQAGRRGGGRGGRRDVPGHRRGPLDHRRVHRRERRHAPGLAPWRPPERTQEER